MKNKWPWIFSLFLLLGPAGAFAAPLQIGLIYNRPQWNAWLENREDWLANYAYAIETNGQQVARLYFGEKEEDLARVFKQIDALLIPGGGDIPPQYWGEKVCPALETVDEAFTEFEFLLLQRAEEARLPVLGICRGMQLLNVFRGGSLYQDLPSELDSSVKVVHRIRREGKSQPCYHALSLPHDTLLARLFGQEQINVNSYHHQGVKRLGEKLRVLAMAADGLVEAVESTDSQFILGLQFHPEKELASDRQSNLYFKKFFEEVTRLKEQPARP